MHTQARTVARFLYNHNPFYLLSACLVLYGLQIAFHDSGPAPLNVWLLISTLSGYTLLLAVTAYAVVRYGRVWEDARSLALLIIFMFVAISVSFDQVCNTFPTTAMLALSFALGFSLVLSEGLIRALRVDLPAGYRMPLYLMFALFFLYPLWVSPIVSSLPDISVALRVLFFPTLAGLILLTLIPAIHRGSKSLAQNGTPWPWPWYPWPIFVFLAIGVCFRAYVLTFSFQASSAEVGFEWRTTFGLYYLTPLFFAVLLLLNEIAVVERRRGLGKFVMLSVPFAVLSAVPLGGGAAFAEFLSAFVQRFGSPLWLALIAAIAFYGYLRARGARAAEYGILSSLAAATLIGPGTLGLNSLTEPQAWPLALIGCLQLHKALQQRSSIRWLVAAASVMAAAGLAFRGSWFTAFHAVIPLHLMFVTMLLIATTCHDRFALILRQVCALLTVLAAVAISARGGVADSYALIYAVCLTLFATAVWKWTGREAWKVAMFGNAATVCFSTILCLQSGFAATIPARAITAMNWGAVCFCVAAVISAIKGGVGSKFKKAAWSLIETVRGELREKPS